MVDYGDMSYLYGCPAETEAMSGAHGEGLKKFIHGAGNIARKVGHAIVRAEQWVVKESKVFAKGVKKAAGKIKAGAKKLVHRKDKATGKDVFQMQVPIISAAQAATLNPASVVMVGDNAFAKKSDLVPGKPITIATDSTGKQSIGQNFDPKEVVGSVDTPDGNVAYYPADDQAGMSSNMKTGLIVGGLLLVASVTGYLIYKHNKKG